MNNDFHQHIIQKAPFGYAHHEIILDKAGKPSDYRFIEVNEAFEKLTGLRMENLIGRTVRKVIPGIEKGDFDWIGFYGKIALECGEEEFEQYSEPLKKLYRVQVFSSEKMFFTTIFIDITNQKLKDEKLRESEAKYKLLFESNPHPMFVYDLETLKFLAVNNAAVSKYGYSSEEFLAMTIMDIRPEEDVARLLDNIKKLDQGYDEAGEWRHILKSGTVIHVEITSHVVDYQGRRAEIVLAVDITGRKSMEMALRGSETRLRNLIESSNDGICLHDLKGNIVFLNKRKLEMLGYESEEQLLGTNVYKLLKENEQQRFQKLSRVLFEKGVLNNIETEVTRSDGSTLAVDVNFCIIRDESGRPQFIMDTMRDITWRKQAEKALSESEKRYAFLTHTANDLAGFTTVKELYTYAACKIKQLLNGHSIVAIVEYNHKDNLWEMQHLEGVSNSISQLTKLFGFDLRQARGEISTKYYDRIISGNLTEMEFDFPGLFNNRLTNVIGSAVKKMLSVEKLYCIAFKQNNQIFGNITFTINTKTGPPDPMLIEAFVAQLGSFVNRLKAEQERIESEIKFRNLANSGLALIWASDPDRQCYYVNDPWLAFTGRTPEQELGTGRIQGIHPDDREHFLDMFNTAFDKRKTFEAEYRLQHHSGQYFWIRELGSPNYGHNGEFKGYICHCFNIEEEKRNQLMQQVQFSIARSTYAADTVEELLEIIRTELGRLLDASNFFVALYDPGTDTLKQLIYKDEKESFTEWPAEKSLSGHVVRSGKPVLLQRHEIEGFARKQNLDLIGSTAACWLGVPMIVKNQIAGAMVVQSYDHTHAYHPADIPLLEMIAHETGIFLEKQWMLNELIAARNKAEESDRLKSAFLNNISHEVRTPLNGILGFGQIMAQTGLSQTEKNEYLGILRKSVDRLMNTITSYVDISMIVSGSLSVNKKVVSLTELLKPVYDMYKPKCDAKELALGFQISPDIQDLKLITDPELLRKALKHILDNAVQFTEIGNVEIQAELKGTEIIISVTDSGIGVDPAFLHRIFDVFVQEDMRISRNFEGSGLGLAIAKGFVTALGGRITIESEKGVGTGVRIALPYETEEMAVKKAETEKPKAASPLVLVAEDEITNYLYLEVLLTKSGIGVLHAKNGAEAVELCRQHPEINLVFMDIKMPVMDGLEATRQIKEFRKDLPIIAITAYAQTGDEFRIREAGCDDYLAKPVNLNQLNTLINKMLG